MESVKVLYINGGIMNRGGIESFMMNYFRYIDRKRVQIDFVVHGYEKGSYDEEIEQRGGKIYHVPTKSKHPIIYRRELKKIFSTGEYSIVHSHVDAMSCWILKMAKQCNVPVRIAHSHNTDHLTTNRVKYFINEQARKNIHKYATHCFACSEAAGKWLFGSIDFKVIPNAINLEKFRYDDTQREALRRELGIPADALVLGHVGRFDTQKNHVFLVRVFKEVSQINKEAVLLLIGEGWMEPQIRELARQEKLEDRVLFLGSRSDVNRLYNAMDCYVFPSLFEGLGVVLIEAQSNGLPCFVSDRVTKEVDVTHTVKFLPLNEKAWIDALVGIKQTARLDTNKEIQNAGYDISSVAKDLEDLYIGLGTRGKIK